LKTLSNQYGQVVRKSDDEAADVVKLNYGWKYCPKHVWREHEQKAKTETETGNS